MRTPTPPKYHARVMIFQSPRVINQGSGTLWFTVYCALDALITSVGHLGLTLIFQVKTAPIQGTTYPGGQAVDLILIKGWNVRTFS